MYNHVKKLQKDELSQRQSAVALDINRRTVKRYGSMTEEEFEAFSKKAASKPKLLDSFEDFIVRRLRDAPAASTAQIHDWLKECHPDFPKIAIKTVYNYVMAIRQKFSIPIESVTRGMMMVEELPYGFQAQIDFGVSHIKTPEGKQKKVHFFTMVLSRSRMKFVFFLDKPFTTQTTIEAHEKAFEFIGGIPHELVYDQDRVMMVSENLGELLLTQEFKTYVASHKLGLFFCRKADPASKGKIENVVRYVKHNFLYGRKYYTTEILQNEAIAWLERTANANIHTITGLIPTDVWEKEVPHLRIFRPAKIQTVFKEYALRKDNMISYKGNFYSVPVGTYQRGVKLLVGQQSDKLAIKDLEGKIICTHSIPEGKNHKVINNNHKRDNSIAIAELKKKVALLFPNHAEANKYLDALHKTYTRYIRNQLISLSKVVVKYPPETVNHALTYCLEAKLYSPSAFKDALEAFKVSQTESQQSLPKVIPIAKNEAWNKINIQPDTRSLDVYDSIYD